MSKQLDWVARLILAALIASLAACQSGGGGGNQDAKNQVTDPNTSFSNPATRQ
jgi:hypothetical protein